MKNDAKRSYFFINVITMKTVFLLQLYSSKDIAGVFKVDSSTMKIFYINIFLILTKTKQI